MSILKYLVSSLKKFLKKKPSSKKRSQSPRKKIRKIKPSSKKAVIKEIPVGEVTHFFPRIKVIVVKMKGGLHVGDQIHIKGKQTDFKQKVKSLQIESVNVPSVHRGQLVGLKVIRAAGKGDLVLKPTRTK